MSSLDNEARTGSRTTGTFYRDYTRGMTPRQIGKEFQDDSRRLLALYRQAVGMEPHKEAQNAFSPGNFLKLIGELLTRLTPMRRLALGVSFAGMAVHILWTGPLAALALPLSIIILVLLLLLELLEKSDAKQEISLARDIQISLLPQSDIRHNQMEFASFASTASEVGGDYVDVIPARDGVYCVVADVSGKGLYAALYMVRLQALVHLVIEKFEPDPATLLTALNDYIKSGARDKTFVTACAAFFPDKSDKPVQLCRAGHNAPMLYLHGDKAIRELRSDGMALGMAPTPVFKNSLKQLAFHMKSGDNLLIYTDGLTEARNERGEQYEEFRLRSLFDLYGPLNASTIRHKIQVSLEDFIQSSPLTDDITFTCIHKHD